MAVRRRVQGQDCGEDICCASCKWPHAECPGISHERRDVERWCRTIPVATETLRLPMGLSSVEGATHRTVSHRADTSGFIPSPSLPAVATGQGSQCYKAEVEVSLTVTGIIPSTRHLWCSHYPGLLAHDPLSHRGSWLLLTPSLPVRGYGLAGSWRFMGHLGHDVEAPPEGTCLQPRVPMLPGQDYRALPLSNTRRAARFTASAQSGRCIPPSARSAFRSSSCIRTHPLTSRSLPAPVI